MLLAAPLYGPWNGASALKGSRLESPAWLYAWTALWAVSFLLPFHRTDLSFTLQERPRLSLPLFDRAGSRKHPAAVLTLVPARRGKQFAELSNLKTHLTLASLRPKGTKVRQVPRGYGFNTVSCGNYFFESIAWVAFTGLTLNWAGKPKAGKIQAERLTRLTLELLLPLQPLALC